MFESSRKFEGFRKVAVEKRIPDSVVRAVIAEWLFDESASDYFAQIARATPDDFWSVVASRCCNESALPDLHRILITRGADGLTATPSSEKVRQDQRIVNTIEKLLRLLQENPLNGAANLSLPILLGYSAEPKYAEHRKSLRGSVDSLLFYMDGPTPSHILECLKNAVQVDGRPFGAQLTADFRSLPRQTGGEIRITLQWFMQELIDWFSKHTDDQIPEALLLDTAASVFGAFNEIPSDLDIKSVYRAAVKNRR